MKIQIKNRHQIEKATFLPKTALISITDRNYHFAELKDKPDYLLQLAFDDVDRDEEGGIADEQAKQIAEFYLNIKDKAEIIICQCEHGQSRSAAIAAAIMEYRSRSGIKIFAHEKYYPNKAIFNKVFEELKKL